MSMELSLSERARRTHEQPISYLMAEAVNNPGLISLAAGLVDYTSLPSREIVELAGELFSRPGLEAKLPLQYGITPGLTPLRHELLDLMMARDGTSAAELSVSVENVVITTGSQQLLFLLTDILVDPGDIVITAWPSYFVYTGALETMGADVRCVDIDENGMRPDSLEETLRAIEAEGQLSRVKIVYVVDYHQNPTGITLSEERRPQILELVKRFSRDHRIVLLEDAAYRELTYEGEAPRTIKSLDPENRFVALAHTFSKTFSPGIKVGYGLLPDDLVEPVLLLKGSHDFGSPNFGQYFVLEAMRRGFYARHVEELRALYTRKRDVLLESLEESFGEFESQGMRWTRPTGGLYVWLTFPESIDTGFDRPLFRSSREEGAIYVPGACCYAADARREKPGHEARLSYGAVSEDEIREGVRRLGRAFRKVMERKST